MYNTIRKLLCIVIAAALTLGLGSCASQEDSSPLPAETEVIEENELKEEAAAPSETAVPAEPQAAEDAAESANVYDLTGPWHLEERDADYLAETFPGYGEWGSSMEIRSSGQISWYIGAEGWNGTYVLEIGGLRADMIADLDRTEKTWYFQLAEEDGNAYLKMDYNGTALVWKYGEQPDSPDGEGDEG